MFSSSFFLPFLIWRFPHLFLNWNMPYSFFFFFLNLCFDFKSMKSIFLELNRKESFHKMENRLQL